MFIRYILGVFFVQLLVISDFANAQPSIKITQPIVGKPCPDFLLNNIVDFENKRISLHQLKGIPFILDFFSTGCTACFASFPKLNKLNEEFSGKVLFFLVGRDDKYIRKAYETFKKKENLQLPHLYDTSNFIKLGVNGVPHLIWVNRNGTIVAITSSTALSDSNVSAFIDGKSFLNSNADETLALTQSFDTHKPFLLDSIGYENTFFQRSLITAWNKNMGTYSQGQVEGYIKLGIPLQIVGWPLAALYKFAYTNQIADWTPDDTVYYGKYHYAPVYEMKDSTLFKFDWDLEANKFCYSQILPSDKRQPDEMLKIMQSDLYNAFGFDAKVVTRKMPYLRLVKQDPNSTPLKSLGGDRLEESFVGGVNFKNASIESLVSTIAYKAELVSKDLPLIDETGIVYPIDIHLNATMTDIEDVKKELSLQGLAIIPGTKDMKVLIIGCKPGEN